MNKFATAFLAALLAVLVSSAPAPAWNFFGLIDNSYTVIFEDLPNLSEDQPVYDGDSVMGEVSDITVKGGSVVATLKVPEEMAPRITEDTVFYVDKGRLRTYRLGESPKVMPDGSYLLGFSDKLALDLFRAKRAMDDLGQAIQDKAEELRKKFE